MTTNCSCASDDSEQKKFSAPMPVIGVYIAAASLICTLAMAADVFHGIRHRKLWFPCKYFTLNAASLTVIAVATKLPVDLNTSMPRTVDQCTKLSSTAFMCIMMANFMPSLGPMNSCELLTNVTALGILVITIIVNVCIELFTGVIGVFEDTVEFDVYMFILLTLLISSALMVPNSKKILEHKYQEMHKITWVDESERSYTVEKLIENVSKYWIMEETSNPQFVLACSPTCSASGAICFFIAYSIMDSIRLSFSTDPAQVGESDYRWSVFPIFAIQSIGVAVGAIAPLFRLFRAFSFKFSLKRSKKYLQVYKIENYWTRTLVEWKSSRVPLPIGNLKCQKFVHEFRNLLLNALIGFQILFVVLSKVLQVFTIFIVIMFSKCWYCCKWLTRKLIAIRCASKRFEHDDSVLRDLSPYVLQLEDDAELANRTLKSIIEAVHKLIREAEKEQPANLMKLLKKSTGFQGVAKFCNSHVPPLDSSQPPNSWSLVVVTLTVIVIALPKAKNGTGYVLLSSISEGLRLVRLVEESLYPTEENLVNVRKAASIVWLQVELYHRWMDEDLQNQALRGKAPMEILQRLSDKSVGILSECKKSTYAGPADCSFLKVVAANSMYIISQSILLDYDGSESQTEEMLVDKLSIMIADILIACLSNIQRVIARKCDAHAIGKREANVKTAARLIGQTKEIVKFLQQRELPSLDHNKLGYIDEWHAFLNHQSPSNTETVSSSVSTGVE